MTQILGINGIKGNLPTGVGFVILPDNVDIQEYKDDVYRSGRITIYGGYGHSNFNNVLIDRETLQRVRFPKKSGEMGTPVVWVNIPKHNEVVVVAALKYDEDYFSLSEFRKRTTAYDEEGNFVDIDLDAKKGKITITGSGKTKRQEIEINLNSRDNDSVFKILIDGELLAKATDRMVFVSEKLIDLSTTTLAGIVNSRIRLNGESEDERLTYEDDFENKINSKKDFLEFRADKSSKINFGDGNEKVVLGDTLKKILEEYDDALAKMTVPTAFGPSGTRINDAEFRKVRSKFEDFLSKLTNTD